MKKLILFPVILWTLKSLCQDTTKIKYIDSIVRIINQSDLIITTDSIVQNMPDLGLFMKIFVASYLAFDTRLTAIVHTLSSSKKYYYSWLLTIINNQQVY